MRVPRDRRSTSSKDYAEFMIYEFKVSPCTVTRQHEWKNCCFYHESSSTVENARRRSPRVYNYVADPCSEFMQKGTCPKGDACPLAHGVFETWLHPTKFCTVMCTEGQACKRKVCWFAHSASELRTPTPVTSPLPAPTPAPQVGSPYGSLQQCAQSPPASLYSAAMNGMSPMLRERRSSYLSSAGTHHSASARTDTGTTLHNNAVGSGSSCSSVTGGKSTSYYVRKGSVRPLAAGPHAQLPLNGSTLLSCAHLAQHNVAISAAALQEAHAQQAVSAGICPPALASPAAALFPSGHLIKQLQHLQQQQELQGLQGLTGVQRAPPQGACLQLPGVASPLSGLIGLSDSSAAVPVSIMPMLDTTAMAAGGDGLALDVGALNPLSGLVTSLEEQAWQAQLKAANAQAVAAAASNNLQAVLSALGGLSESQGDGGGVCASSPLLGAVGSAQAVDLHVPATTAVSAGAGFQFGLI